MAEQHGRARDDNHSKPLSGPLYPPPYDQQPSRPRWRRPEFRVRLVRCVCALLIALLSIVGVGIFVTWLSIRPHKPRVFLDHASISQLSISPKGIVNTNMNFNISSRNSNEKMGINYNSIDFFAVYSGQDIAWGTLPGFHQGTKSTTVMQPELKGEKVKLGKQIPEQMAGDRASGQIEIDVKMKAKTSFQLGRWNSRDYKMTVKCSKVVIHLNGGPFRRQQCIVYF